MLAEIKRLYKVQSDSVRRLVVELYVAMLEDGGISTTQLYQFGRYQQLLQELTRITEDTAARQLTLMEEELNKAYKAAFQKTTVAQGTAAVWGIQNTHIMEQVVNGNFKGSNFSQRIWKGRQSAFDLLKREIENIVASGQSKDTAVKAIRKATNASFQNADRLVRTETMRVINAGQRQSYIAAGRTHGCYLMANDDRLCEYCKRLAIQTKLEPMQLELMDDSHHPNCRCTIKPIVNIRGGI